MNEQCDEYDGQNHRQANCEVSATESARLGVPARPMPAAERTAQELSLAVVKLGVTTEQLTIRLRPVLLPERTDEAPAEAAGAPHPPTPPLFGEMDQHIRQIDALSDVLIDLIERLGL